MSQRKKNYLCAFKKNKMKYQFLFLNSILIVLICVTVACKKPASEPDLPTPKPIPTSVTDIDGNEYSVKQFGKTLWMTENLKVTRYDTESPRSGDTITQAVNNKIVDIEKPYYYEVKDCTNPPYTDNLTDKIRQSLGFLYNWSAAAGVVKNGYSVADKIQGICPNGWRLPNVKDLDSLCYYVGGAEVAGKKLKSNSGWYTGSGSNESEMNCYPAGLAAGNVAFLVGQQTMFWSSYAIINSKSAVFKLFFDQDAAEVLYINQYQANSVRCVMDL